LRWWTCYSLFESFARPRPRPEIPTKTQSAFLSAPRLKMVPPCSGVFSLPLFWPRQVFSYEAALTAPTCPVFRDIIFGAVGPTRIPRTDSTFFVWLVLVLIRTTPRVLFPQKMTPFKGIGVFFFVGWFSFSLLLQVVSLPLKLVRARAEQFFPIFPLSFPGFPQVLEPRGPAICRLFP